MSYVPEVAAIGGGMIMHDQILPALFQLQRNGVIGERLRICDRQTKALDALANAPGIRTAFPERNFTPFPGDYRDLLAELPPRQIVVVALPDQIHYEVVMAALAADQHVVCVKPLVLRAAQAAEIEEAARARGLMVAVEYHKRFDDRALLARRRFREGHFGEFRLGNACLHEKWEYRHSNFQNWFTAENTDAFTYIGCHYVDLVHFITGLQPTAVSAHGILDRFPNGNEGYLWVDARVLWENGGALNVQTSLSYPQAGPGTNLQGLTMFFSGTGEGALLVHSDQYRGLAYCFNGAYTEPSPDYFQYNDLGGTGRVPVGYGVRSVEHIVRAAIGVEQSADRAATLAALDEQGVIATPANSRYNELVVEAGRLSLLNHGRLAVIDYESNSVRLEGR